MRAIAWGLVLVGVLCVHGEGASGHFESGAEQVALVELYTSQGCSSCPPAEALISRLKDDDRLWREIVPVAFHVDYWDRLGWPDPFADPRFTLRQRQIAEAAQAGRVYTPNFVVNGGEWRGFFRGEGLDPEGAHRPGVLRVSVDSDRVEVHFDAADSSAGTLTVHLAVLGVDLHTEVRAGENRGRKLPQDFVALNHAVWDLRRTGAVYRGEGTLEIPATEGRAALAVWVSRQGALTPLQAVGGWLGSGAAADSLHRGKGAVY